MKALIDAILTGLVSGSLYAAMALGLTIVYGVVRIFNFAHGLMALMGGYFAWALLTNMGIGLVPAIILSCVVMYFFGLILYLATIKPLLRKPDWEMSTVIFTLGAGILIENTLLQVFGPRFKSIPKFMSGRIKFGYFRMQKHDIILLVIIVIFFLIFIYFLKKSWFGQAMRAVAQDMDGARIVGINLHRTFSHTFALAMAVTGFSGILLATKLSVSPSIGWDWATKGFVIIVLGGWGSVPGAFYAALILGIIEALTMLYIGTMWVFPIWTVIFLLVLLVRPQGLLGGRTD
ncbi:MAG: branched-chain amino acid ABC transporter permease [Deltaproteobacteria bacterium]|jgi:branched-chain amino acid transport system permease protein|nr:branched-chain amino acid ABC transporter permease [Deltaproteobacteria bacterium]MBT4269533.1 branched-chain amino acid ABC transporter permease [Deltaproteobacteria bacterium]MBT4642624.1 branched-chain amino acid ABC transporter permease [Deltaproteobacteria bacterium]MBT6501287.1 branched-chain amino acid ABC transporter permease [Deltaproteobacteria bacterium]MBT7151623.1 branched-chain amino acid ABC transporter permease [Deltaproteobacteria bacterium]